MARRQSRARVARSDRYRLRERLGTGATATVWRAHDRVTGRDVCLKRIHPHLVDDEATRARLRAEIAAAHRIHHPAIVPLADAQLSDEQPAVVFDFVPGVTLAQRLADDGPLQPAEAALIGEQIAAALAAAHAAGVVHRDVKPSNVLLGRDGQARLLDFGISRAIEDTQRDVTGAGLAIGTLPYMAPEQLAGQPPAPANDVYALGAVLHQALSGSPPVAGDTPLAVARAQRTSPPPLDGIDGGLAALIHVALAYDPADRPPAERLARRLHAWRVGGLDSEKATTVVPAMAAPARPRWLRRPSRSGAAVGVLLAALSLALVSALAFAPDWSAPDSSDAPVTPPAAPAEPKELAPAVVVDEPVAEPARAEPKPAEPPKAKAKGKAKDKGKSKGKGGGGRGKGKEKGDGPPPGKGNDGGRGRGP